MATVEWEREKEKESGGGVYGTGWGKGGCRDCVAGWVVKVLIAWVVLSF